MELSGGIGPLIKCDRRELASSPTSHMRKRNVHASTLISDLPASRPGQIGRPVSDILV